MAKDKDEQIQEAQEERVDIFVPKAVAEEFYRSQAAEERRDAQQDTMKKA